MSNKSTEDLLREVRKTAKEHMLCVPPHDRWEICREILSELREASTYGYLRISVADLRPGDWFYESEYGVSHEYLCISSGFSEDYYWATAARFLLKDNVLSLSKVPFSTHKDQLNGPYASHLTKISEYDKVLTFFGEAKIAHWAQEIDEIYERKK